MQSTQIHCDEALIRRHLDGDLAPADEAALGAHLDQCEACRRVLEGSAADESWWRDAGRFLPVDQWDGAASVSLGELHSDAAEQATEGTGADVLRRLRGWLDPTDDPRMLGRFGGYEIVGIIGEGGMGIVLKGHEPSLNRSVAIKLLAPHLASSGAARQRFSREARAAAAVLHENVIAIHRVEESRALPFLVMPYIAGESLQKRLDREGPLPVVAILRIGRQIAAGLAAAHAQGLVHRDVKPANILLENGVDRVTLTDFGLARAVDDATVTRSGVIAGTPQYMSPEQARGDAVDTRSDLFSLGSVMYAMCTGRPPFRAETGYGILRRITDTEPRPIREINPDIPDWLAAIVGRLHAKSAADRYQTPGDVAELLEQWLAHVQHPTLVVPPSFVVPPWFVVPPSGGPSVRSSEAERSEGRHGTLPWLERFLPRSRGFRLKPVLQTFVVPPSGGSSVRSSEAERSEGRHGTFPWLGRFSTRSRGFRLKPVLRTFAPSGGSEPQYASRLAIRRRALILGIALASIAVAIAFAFRAQPRPTATKPSEAIVDTVELDQPGEARPFDPAERWNDDVAADLESVHAGLIQLHEELRNQPAEEPR